MRNITKKHILIPLLAIALLTVFALPTSAGTTTLAALVSKVKRIAKDGTMKAQFVKYGNTSSGIKSTTVQGALDELGTALSKRITGSQKTAAATSIRAMTNSFESTTWTGTASGYFKTAGANDAEGLVACADATYTWKDSKDITVTFTPTSETSGTFVASPYYPFKVSFNAIGGSLCIDGSVYEQSQQVQGYYRIVGNVLVTGAKDLVVGGCSDCLPMTSRSSGTVETRGNTMTYFGNDLNPALVLTRK